jgi:putative holliday junction resolvase
METGRIMAIDYGKKRVGIAVTDPMQMIATRLTTVLSGEIWKFLDDYFQREKVVLVLVGYPVQMNNEPSQAVTYINPFLKAFVKKYPQIPLRQADERFTSRLAHQAMIDGGLKKSGRQDKALVDGISAVIILQSYMEQFKFHS